MIALSRFGSSGSTLSSGTTPADQAYCRAVLLDHLGVQRAVVMAYSAGSGSVLEFGLRYPQWVIAFILASCRLGGGVTVGRAFEPLFRFAYGEDYLFWAFKRLLPTMDSRMMGVPKGYRPSPRDTSPGRRRRKLGSGGRWSDSENDRKREW